MVLTVALASCGKNEPRPPSPEEEKLAQQVKELSSQNADLRHQNDDLKADVAAKQSGQTRLLVLLITALVTAAVMLPAGFAWGVRAGQKPARQDSSVLKT
jgi:hypothetical protein